MCPVGLDPPIQHPRSWQRQPFLRVKQSRVHVLVHSCMYALHVAIRARHQRRITKVWREQEEQAINRRDGEKRARKKCSPGFIVEGRMHEGWRGGKCTLTGRARMADTSPCTHGPWFFPSLHQRLKRCCSASVPMIRCSQAEAEGW